MARTGTIFSKIEWKKTTYPAFSCIINNALSLQGSLEVPLLPFRIQQKQKNQIKKYRKKN